MCLFCTTDSNILEHDDNVELAEARVEVGTATHGRLTRAQARRGFSRSVAHTASPKIAEGLVGCWGGLGPV